MEIQENYPPFSPFYPFGPMGVLSVAPHPEVPFPFLSSSKPCASSAAPLHS